jgi:Predicted transcriptional regulator
MAVTPPTSLATAYYSLLELHWPGKPVENAGVLLADPASGQSDVRLRRDWAEIVSEEDREVFEALEDDLRSKLREFGPENLLSFFEQSLSLLIRISDREQVEVDDFSRTLGRLYRKFVPARVLPFRTHLPVYSLRAAAGRFGADEEVFEEEWIEAPPDLRLSEDHFVAHVTGDSMEPLIPDGSLCVFRRPRAGSRQGKIVLVWLRGTSEGGGQVTVKRYRSEKKVDESGSWAHTEIVMEPLNRKYKPWRLEPEEQENLLVIGEFVCVLK